MKSDVRHSLTGLGRHFIVFVMVPLLSSTAWAENKPAMTEHKMDKSFAAIISDAKGVDTELKNLLFYWEEKISETAFVPHELPVKRGSATINVKFDGVKTIDVKSAGDKNLPLLVISLANGNTAEFARLSQGT